MNIGKPLFLLTIGAWALATAQPAPAGTYTRLWEFCTSANHDVCSSAQGAQPKPLVQDSNGNLFGVATKEGHGTAWGIVYELASGPSGYTYQELYEFCPNGQSNCVDGAYPVGQLVIDTSGNLYGATQEGGALGYGSIYRLSNSTHGWVLTTLWSFCQNNSCAKGSNPIAGLTYIGASSGTPYDGTSSLFGTTSAGGAWGGGTVYELKTPAGTPSLKSFYSFCPTSDCGTGSNPNALIADASGNLFGTTQTGGYYINTLCPGNSGCGVAYEISAADGSFTLLHTFCLNQPATCTDATMPVGQMVMDAQGNLFGTGHGGNNSGCGDFGGPCGAIFKIVPNGASSTESIYYSFCSEGPPCSATGSNPSGTLALDSNGRFYGTASGGGQNGKGTIFKLSGSLLSTLYSFCSSLNCTDGATPLTGVIRDSSGNLFGVTFYGGVGNDVFPAGVAFKWSP